jgi:hypothetical protein
VAGVVLPAKPEVCFAEWKWEGGTPCFFVSVAFKGFRYFVSPLFATHTRMFANVASKGVRLHPACADAYRLRTPWQGSREARGRQGKRGDRGEEGDGVNRASWRVTIKGQGSMGLMQWSSTYWISIRMSCGKLLQNYSF